MKTPRITYFDPDAKVPVLKSSFDNMPAIEKPKEISHNTVSAEHILSVVQKDWKQSDKKPAKPISSVPQSPKRSYVRRTFDFFEDQIAYLTQKSLQEKLTGKDGSMNSMVREAIDDWIKKRSSEK